MLRSISQDITIATDGAESVPLQVKGVSNFKRTIKHLAMEGTGNTTLLGYLDQDRIVEQSTELQNAAEIFPEINIELKVGETFQAGYRNNTGGSATKKVTVWYDEEAI